MCISKEDDDSINNIQSDEESLASVIAGDNSFTSHRAYIVSPVPPPEIHSRRETNITSIHTIG